MKSPKLKSDVTPELRQSILQGRYTPNQRLVEADLAGLLGTNRVNVRTALARLEQEGFVVREPKRGARVRVFTHEDALDTAFARGAFEKLLARQAAACVDKDHRNKLREIQARLGAARTADDMALFSQCTVELHRTIRAMAQNSTVNRILDTLLFSMQRLHYRAIMLQGWDNSVLEHAAIIEAICNNDPDAAETATQRHFDSIIAGLRREAELKSAFP